MIKPSITVLMTVALCLGLSHIQAAEISTWIEQNTPELVALYQDLHRAPELSFQEAKTAARIAAELRDVGAKVTTGIGGHGVVGILTNGAGKTLLLRTDLDALPIKEETGLKYASKVRVDDPQGNGQVGVMHACGHDMHMSIFVGVARYLASHRETWQGTIMFIGQPAEEQLAGANAMLKDGLYKRFGKPDFALALHVAADFPAGVVGYGEGYVAAASDSVDITLFGEGGHGAAPHKANDPIVQAAQLILALQTIVAREIDPLQSAVISVGAIHSGTAHNIIPDTCDLKLTVRSYQPEVREALYEAIERKAIGVARSMGARKPRVRLTVGTEPLYNDPALAKRLVPALRRSVGEANIVPLPPVMSSEDFSMYSVGGVPTFLFALGSAFRTQVSDRSEPWPVHSPKYAPDVEPTLATGITAMVNVATELLPRQK